jgi:uncharacterized coiled-coil protein SlyX
MNHCDHSESWASDVGKLNKVVKQLETRIENQRTTIKHANRKVRNQRKTIARLKITVTLLKETNNANV